MHELYDDMGLRVTKLVQVEANGGPCACHSRSTTGLFDMGGESDPLIDLDDEDEEEATHQSDPAHSRNMHLCLSVRSIACLNDCATGSQEHIRGVKHGHIRQRGRSQQAHPPSARGWGRQPSAIGTSLEALQPRATKHWVRQKQCSKLECNRHLVYFRGGVRRRQKNGGSRPDKQGP